MEISFGWHKHAGLMYVGWGEERGRIVCLHFIVRPKYWRWGFDGGWYDGPINEFGMGPLFLAAWL